MCLRTTALEIALPVQCASLPPAGGLVGEKELNIVRGAGGMS